jgi:hypothetical protein
MRGVDMTNQEIEKQIKLVRESYPGNAEVLRLCAMTNLLLSQRKSDDQLAKKLDEDLKARAEAGNKKSGKKPGDPEPSAA